MKLPLKVFFFLFSLSTAVLTTSCRDLRTHEEPGANEPATNESVENESVENEIEENDSIEDKDIQLVEATQKGELKTVKLLLQNGAYVDTDDEYGTTPLMCAVQEGNFDLAKLLIEHEANVNAKDNDGDTALMIAAQWGYLDIVKLLLENSADVNAQNRDRETALSLARNHNHSEVAELLGSRQAKPTPQVRNTTQGYSKAENKQEHTTASTSNASSQTRYTISTPSRSGTTAPKNGYVKQYPERSVEENRGYTEKTDVRANEVNKTARKNEGTTSGISEFFVGILLGILLIVILFIVISRVITFIVWLFSDHPAKKNPPPYKPSGPTTTTATKEAIQKASGETKEAQEHPTKEPPKKLQRGIFDKFKIPIPHRLQNHTSKEDIGELAEISVHNKLVTLPDEYNVIYDVLLFKSEKQSTQIDHIVTSPYGVFIIETKSWGGIIKGNEEKQYWTQYRNGNRNEFYNPILQNKGHVRFIDHFLSSKIYRTIPIIPIVVFAGTTDLQVEVGNHNVVHISSLIETIYKHNTREISEELQKEIEKIIEQNAKVGEEWEELHKKNVEEIKKRRKEAEQPTTPSDDDSWHKSQDIISVVLHEDSEALRSLLDHGANINAKDEFGDAAILVAASKGNGGIVEQLINAGANVNEKNEFGDTPLMIAATINSLGPVELLVEHGANVNDKNNNNWSALMFAIDKSNLSVAKFLFEHGAEIEEVKNEFGDVALRKAGDEDNKDIAKFLVEKGANVDVRGASGYTLLISAVLRDDLDFAKTMIELGANVNARDWAGRTALMYAAGKGNLEMVTLLLESGADVNVEDNIGHKVLWYCSRYPEVEKLLRRYGATD